MPYWNEGPPLLTSADVGTLCPVERTSATFAERVFTKVEVTPGCWWWMGAHIKGYGVVGRGTREAGTMQAHRAVWELLVGPIPAGLTYDHLCRNHPCVNPEHGEIVTLEENKRRGYSVARLYAARTRCGKGHPLDGKTTCHTGPQTGSVFRYCKTCARARSAERFARIRDAA